MNSKTVNGVKCFLYVFGLLVMALPAQGASFDCGKSATKIEKLICGDAELSKLDEELNAAYKTAMRDEKLADSIKQAQKQWMKERNGCAEVGCVKLAYETRLSSLTVTSKSSDDDATTKQGTLDNSQESQQYHFQLTKGAGTPVCDAYLERLNTTKYEKPPYCDRPEQSTVSGFTSLNRVPLSPEAVHALYPRVNKFVLIGKQGSKEEDDVYEAMLKRNGVGPSIDSIPTMRDYLLHGEMKVWRYDPPVDIDNDGMPDNILMWQGYGLYGSPAGVCGHPMVYTHFSTEGGQPQLAFVMTADSARIDVPKTRAIFGHPSGGYRLPNGEMSTEFRPIGGRTMSTFEYQGIYYFDTFLEYWGEQKKAKNSITLAVFLQKDGNTRQVCEYRMSRPNTTSEEGNK